MAFIVTELYTKAEYDISIFEDLIERFKKEDLFDIAMEWGDFLRELKAARIAIECGYRGGILIAPDGRSFYVTLHNVEGKEKSSD